MLQHRFGEGPDWRSFWEIKTVGRAPDPAVRPREGSSKLQTLYFDGRQAHLTLTSRPSVKLSSGAQYTLIARLAQLGHYGDLRASVIQEILPGQWESLAFVRAEAYSPKIQEHHTTFWAPSDAMTVKLEIRGGGSNEFLIEEVRLLLNDPPLSTYETGTCIRPVTFWGDTFFRSGRLIEAEDVLVNTPPVTEADRDGDHLWALLRFDLPPSLKAPMTSNPWLFSEFSVLKSDSASREEGGLTPPLHLWVRNLLPGRYQAFVSDPFRDAAISLDGKTWRRMKGGKGEINLELIDVGPEGWHLWLDHRYRTLENPGPIYVDYVRFLPVYCPENRREAPRPPQRTAILSGARQVPIRLTQGNPAGQTYRPGLTRCNEWVWTGVPLAPGSMRDGDAVACEGVSDLSARPLLHWSDGSVKWLGVEFRADMPADGERRVTLRWGKKVSGIYPQEGRARPLRKNRWLSLGSVKVEMGSELWQSLLLGKKVLIGSPVSAECRSVDGLHLDGMVTESLRIEGSGPHPTRVAMGHLSRSGQTGPIAFEARLQERAPGVLALTFSFVNQSEAEYKSESGAGPALGLTELRVRLPGVNLAPGEVVWPFGTFPFETGQCLLQEGQGLSTANFSGRWTLHGGSADATLGDRPVLARGDRTAGWLEVRDAGAGLAVGVRDFVERCPRALSVSGTPGNLLIAVDLMPRTGSEPFRWAQGTRLSVEIALCLHQGISGARREAAMAAVLHPVRGILDPEHLCSSGVFGPLVPAPLQEFKRYEESVEDSLAHCVRLGMAYGTEDWGDLFGVGDYYVRGTARMWGNMEYGLLAVFGVHFARTGRREMLDLLEGAAIHYADIDVTHFSTRPGWTGGAHPHSGDQRVGHQVDPPNFAHIHGAPELLWAWCLTGQTRLQHTALEMAEYVLANLPPQGSYTGFHNPRWGRGRPTFGSYDGTREFYLPLSAVLAAYELTREDKYLQAANRLADFGLRLQDPVTGIFEVAWGPGFVTRTHAAKRDGMMGRILLDYWRNTGDPKVEHAFARLADWILDPPKLHPERAGIVFRVRDWFSGYETPEIYAYCSLFSPRRKELLEAMARKFREVYNRPWVSRDPKQLPDILIGGHVALGIYLGERPKR